MLLENSPVEKHLDSKQKSVLFLNSLVYTHHSIKNISLMWELSMSRLQTLLKRQREKRMPCPRKLRRSTTMGSQSESLPSFCSFFDGYEPLLSVVEFVG